MSGRHPRAETVEDLGQADRFGLGPLGPRADLEYDLLALFENLIAIMSMAE